MEVLSVGELWVSVHENVPAQLGKYLLHQNRPGEGKKVSEHVCMSSSQLNLQAWAQVGRANTPTLMNSLPITKSSNIQKIPGTSAFSSLPSLGIYRH